MVFSFSLFGSKMHTAGGSSGLKTNFISMSGFETVMERAQSASCRGYGLCFKAWEGPWLPPWGAGGGSSLEPGGSESLAGGEGYSGGPWPGGGRRGQGTKYSRTPGDKPGLK